MVHMVLVILICKHTGTLVQVQYRYQSIPIPVPEDKSHWYVPYAITYSSYTAFIMDVDPNPHSIWNVDSDLILNAVNYKISQK